jgi:hypothetical protein
MHSCPECDQACYCGGDIDDIDAGDSAAEAGCTHCCDLPEKDYGEDFDYDPADDDPYGA